jgi:hypothetical protein
MNECLRQRHKHLQIEFRQVGGEGGYFSGNKKVTDILLSQRLPRP